MEAEQKAKELINKFRQEISSGVLTPADMNPAREKYRNDQGKRCAIICCDEIIDQLNTSPILNNRNKEYDDLWGYWQQVKTFIKNS